MTFADAYDPIRALQSAWRLLSRAPLPLFVGGVLCWLFSGGPSLGGMFRDDHPDPGAMIAAAVGFGLCCGIVGLLVGSWASVGLAHATEKTMAGGNPARFEDLFETRGRYFEMVLVRLLLILIEIGLALPFVAIVLAGVFAHRQLDLPEGLVVLSALIAALAYLVVWAYVSLGLTLANASVAIEGTSPTAALRRSWELSHGNRLRLLVYWIALAVFTLLGLILCCVGILGTGALSQIAYYESFLALSSTGSAPTSGPAPTPPPVPPAEASPS